MRYTRAIATVLTALVGVVSGVALPTDVLADGGGGGVGSGGGLGPGGGGGGPLFSADCGWPTRVLVLYSENTYGDKSGWAPGGAPPTAVESVAPNHVLQDSIADETSVATNDMAYLIDPETGYAWGPPSLGNSHMHKGKMEGDPPGLTGPLANPSSPPPGFANSGPPTPPSAQDFYPGWWCYTYAGGKPAPPAYVPANPVVPQGQTSVNFANNLLVQENVVAAQAEVCPTDGTAGLPPLGIAPPSPPAKAPGQVTVRRWPTADPAPNPTQCPQSLTVRTFAPSAGGDWDIIIEESPVPDDPTTGCTKGTGGYEWEWAPSTFVGSGPGSLQKSCTTAPNDPENFFHVVDCGGGCPNAPPCNFDCTNYDPQRQGAQAGVSVKLTVHWTWYCYGWFSFDDHAGDAWTHTFGWSPSALRTWTPPDGQADIWVTCDAPVTQYYRSTDMRNIQQIEAIAS